MPRSCNLRVLFPIPLKNPLNYKGCSPLHLLRMLAAGSGSKGCQQRETFPSINTADKLKMVKGKSRPLKFKHFSVPFKVFLLQALADSTIFGDLGILFNHPARLQWSEMITHLHSNNPNTPHIISWLAYFHSASDPCVLNYNLYIGNQLLSTIFTGSSDTSN